LQTRKRWHGIGCVGQPEIDDLRADAEAGDADAQSVLGSMYATGEGVPQDDAEAQSELGFSYLTGTGVPRDYVQAEMWFNLAASQSTDDVGERAVSIRDFAADHMDPTQLAEAERLAREWDAAHPREP
jgi:TPR repeat protein